MIWITPFTGFKNTHLCSFTHFLLSYSYNVMICVAVQYIMLLEEVIHDQFVQNLVLF